MFAGLCNGSANCKLTHRGVEYAGTLSLTLSGTTCQRWDSQTPHSHSYTYAHRFPENSVSDASNYCRNPSNDPRGPWCLTLDPNVHKEYCRVLFCSPISSEFLHVTTREGSWPMYFHVTSCIGKIGLGTEEFALALEKYDQNHIPYSWFQPNILVRIQHHHEVGG